MRQPIRCKSGGKKAEGSGDDHGDDGKKTMRFGEYQKENIRRENGKGKGRKGDYLGMVYR